MRCARLTNELNAVFLAVLSPVYELHMTHMKICEGYETEEVDEG